MVLVLFRKSPGWEEQHLLYQKTWITGLDILRKGMQYGAASLMVLLATLQVYNYLA